MGDPNKKQPSTNARKGRLSMKRLLSLAVLLATLSSCSSSANAATVNSQLNISTPKESTAATHPISLTKSLSPMGPPLSLTILEKQQRHAQKLHSNYTKIQKAVSKVKKTAGKTWYVYSGSSPRGWDCSGLVRWTYEQMGVTLEHSATKQLYSGKHVKKPNVGDIVAFRHPGSTRSFHVGIYIGNGKLIHAYYHGKRTVIQKVSQVQKENWGAEVTYVRILSSSTHSEATHS
jgi:cell wall-associated NlpC family hydrolase